ncbi:MAG: hypothetical protein AB1894_19660 [Chloroflexota bacterium]
MSEPNDLKQMIDRSFSPILRAQLDELCKHLGKSQSEVLALAVERLYQAEIGSVVPTHSPGRASDVARRAKEAALKARQAGKKSG